MWERNLQDLIRGLRSHKDDEARFIASAIDEIRVEVRSEDMELKAGAVVKLTYLEMLGYNMGWASFHVVEVMSSPRFHLKSMGYLAATQSFEQDTDVLMLTTNLLKKDLTSAKALEVAVALNGLSHIVTEDLGRDLTRDLVSLLTHSRPAIRKRAVLAMYKVFLKYPEAIEYGMTRLKERLEDPDIGVVSATVNILCELAKQNPKAYLPFAPPLFHILTTSNNNWMLIKIIKLFGLLTPHEERLIKKLQPPITELISTTPAISLLYECVHTCITGRMLQGASGHSLAKTCVTKLATFLEDPDQNLKYIALLALAKIVSTHPHLVAEYESRILASLDDQDLSIRMRALDLISAMVDRNNLQSIVQHLVSLLAKPDSALSATRTATEALTNAVAATRDTPPVTSPTQSSVSYRTVLAQRILNLCGDDLYARVEDFEWYVSVLIDLAYVARAPVGALIRDQLVDIAVRVQQVRRYAVQVCMRLLEDENFSSESGGTEAEGTGCQEVLWAAAWICGEYSDEFSDTIKIIHSLLPDKSSRVSSDILATYLQSAAKVFGSWAVELATRWDEDDLPRLRDEVQFMITKIRDFASSADFDLQERAANILQLFNFIQADISSYKPMPKLTYENGFADANTSGFDPIGTIEPHYPKSLYLLKPLFSSYALNPVAAEAQTSIPVPEGLDLEAWIVPEAKPHLLEIEDHEPGVKKKKDRKGKGKDTGERETRRKGKKKVQTNVQEDMTQEDIIAQEERAKAKAKRLDMLRDDPYYIIDEKSKQQNVDVESIPVVRLDDLPPLSSVGASSKNTTPSSLPSIRRSSPSPQISFTINRGGEMPPSARQKSPTPQVEHDPKPTEEGAPWRPLESFPAKVEYEDGDSRVSTPDLIKVTRKKKTSSGKKKRPKDGGHGIQ